MDLREIGMDRVNWIWLAGDRVQGFCEHGSEPLGSIKKAGYCLTRWVTISFSKNILHHGVSKYCTYINNRQQ
jgi:hypothetical protein